MFPRAARVLGLSSLRRRGDLDERATVLALFARFTDELASGLLVVLMPTFRARLGLSVAQVGWLWQALFSTAAVVEPLSGAAIDLVRRRPLFVWGALGWSAALLLAAGAPSFGWMLAAFILVGVASGPLAHTADVVLVEAHPDHVERITSRSTALDTIGALLAPSLVAVAAWAGIDQRVLLVVTAAAIGGYGLLLASSVFPPPPGRRHGESSLTQVRTNVGQVLGDPMARRWLAALLLQEVLGLSELFEPVWLRDEIGASQALVAVHVAIGMAATLLTLLLLDRGLTRYGTTPVLVAACVGTAVLYPAWLLAPGIALKMLLVVPRNAAMAPLWPVLRSRSLAAIAGAGGTTTALYSLLGLVPLQAAFGWAASRVGLTATMLSVHLTATLALVLVVGRLGRSDRRPRAGGPAPS
jgi:MFS transporter, FSR family, fosmidomycin resistance protein